jgi:two-component system, cell cycle sensor histidine kinase and response regulator CckA
MKDLVEGNSAPTAPRDAANERYRSVFMHMAEGVALHEIIFDGAGQPVNYRILDVNPQYERFTGLRPEQVIGKLANEIYGSSPPYLREYASVALGGTPLRIEVRFEPLQRDYEISIAPMEHGFFATIFSDVTARKRQEQALRENEWFLQQSQRAGHLGSYRFNVAMGTWVNSPALDEVFGIDASYTRDIDGWMQLLHPEDAQSMGEYLLNDVLKQGKTFDRRYRIVRHSDGEVRWVHGYGALERDADGTVRFMIGTIQDITDATLAEQALRVKTDELDHFFLLTPDMLCIVSADAQLLRVNAAWERILGWPFSELEGRNYLDFVHPDDLEVTKAQPQLQADGLSSVDFTNRYRCRDGSYRWIEWRATPTSNGNIYAAARDVTDWIEHERAMAESEERYRLLVETSPVPVSIHQEGRIVFSNRAAIEMVGATSASEIIGRSLLDFVPDELKAIAQEDIRSVQSVAASSAMQERRLRRLDGKVLDIELTNVQFPYRGAAATLLVVVDVTERKRGEQERKGLEAQLQQSQKLESIGLLAGGVAHDFNNLLTVIMSCTDSLLTAGRQTDDQRSDTLDIADAGRRAAELTRQLLAFSRQQVLQPRIVVVSEVVEKSSRMLRRLLGEDIELTVEASDGSSTVFADPGQLEQILVNLAVNSRDAMPEGGRLTIQTSSAMLTPKDVPGEPEAAAGQYVILTVLDTGIGMDEVTRTRAFDPFFTTKSSKGTGLGLSTVYGIVKQSGGHIWIQSELGAGTTIKICLPHADATPAGSPSRRPPVPNSGDETILLVEDEYQVRRTLERVLVAAGYRVHVAADGEEALRFCESSDRPIHLLLTDVVMPKMTGKQLVERLAVLNKSIPRVLYMSGYMPDTILHHGVLHDGTAFIPKPLTPIAILTKIREVLDG